MSVIIGVNLQVRRIDGNPIDKGDELKRVANIIQRNYGTLTSSLADGVYYFLNADRCRISTCAQEELGDDYVLSTSDKRTIEVKWVIHSTHQNCLHSNNHPCPQSMHQQHQPCHHHRKSARTGNKSFFFQFHQG